MRPPRVTTDADDSMPLGMVPEDVRQRVAEKKLWRVRSILQTDLRVAADYLAELLQHEAWRLFECGSMAEFVEQRGLGLDDEVLSAIRSSLTPPAPADVIEPASAARPRVINLHANELGDAVYVGRRSQRRGLEESPFANPYRVDADGTRADVIEKYHRWLLGQPALLDRLHELRGRRLACWCKPAACHGDVLVELVDADALLDELQAAGVRVEARGDRLALLPASAVDEALVARVRPHKAALLALLAARSSTARRGDRETWEEARLRVAAAEDRLRRDREAWIEAGRKAGVYRGLATDTGDDVI